MTNDWLPAPPNGSASVEEPSTTMATEGSGAKPARAPGNLTRRVILKVFITGAAEPDAALNAPTMNMEIKIRLDRDIPLSHEVAAQ